MSATHSMNGINIKDSGTRRDFGTGSVRDAAAGKGRMDLLPIFALLRMRSTIRDGLRGILSNSSLDDRPRTPDACAMSIRDIMELSLHHALKSIRGFESFHLVKACYLSLFALDMRSRSMQYLEDMSDLGFSYEWCPWNGLLEVSKLYEAGCLKYGDRNWEKGQPLHIYLDSGCRHMTKHLGGHDDEDHLVAASWNFLCCLETYVRIEMGTLPCSLSEGLPSLPSRVNDVAPAEH